MNLNDVHEQVTQLANVTETLIAKVDALTELVSRGKTEESAVQTVPRPAPKTPAKKANRSAEVKAPTEVTTPVVTESDSEAPSETTVAAE